MSASIPALTVLGSCRVFEPIKAMEQSGRAELNQQRVFGYVHNSREILQQLRLMTGHIPKAGRLRQFLNIPAEWKWLPPEEAGGLGSMFMRTDAFIVEISSIRLLRFKALYLQLNRTRELLVRDDVIESRWWWPLVREGRNEPLAYILSHALTQLSAVEREVMANLVCSEQTVEDVVKDIKSIQDALPGPALFVCHFNANVDGVAIEQRRVIQDALEQARTGFGINYWDPTQFVLEAGPQVTMRDGAHYRPDVIPQVGEYLLDGAMAAKQAWDAEPARSVG